jgi:hypothetical protein
MKSHLAIAMLVFCGSVLAQEPKVEKASVSTGSKPAPVSNSSQASRQDLNHLLADLGRITSVTDSDISELQVGSGKSSWLKSKAHKHQAGELAASLDLNLKQALPVLIRDAQDSEGSVTASFKLYNELSVLVESVGLLVESAESAGTKVDLTPLRNDYQALSSLRQQLASYIQVTADSLEPADHPPHRGSPAYAYPLSASNRVSGESPAVSLR